MCGDFSPDLNYGLFCLTGLRKNKVIHKLPLTLITDSVRSISKPNTKSPVLVGGKGKIMTKQTLASPLGATYSITFDKADNWGSIECVYRVSVWHDTNTNEIAIIIERSQSDKDGRYSKHFKDCETQHSDAERWVNDIIQFPNPIAGVFLMEAWKE